MYHNPRTLNNINFNNDISLQYRIIILHYNISSK